ncbi:hypothetical protein UPYG_G00239460 [Umbra pygmaea]|uniref:Ig-like domain-containing protein n=1 Tax=Umbra pygmaea TaxID=75934 RepID=A0ABD0WZ73_UMBPY
MMIVCLIFPLLMEMAGARSSTMQLVSAHIGGTVILQCIHGDTLAMQFLWYKQAMGENLKISSNFYDYEGNATFHNEFKDNPRFSIQNGKGINHLKITDIQISDSAMYYCGGSYSNKVEFVKGVILIVKGLGFKNTTIIEQPVSESVQPGDSVTLNCTIHTETCAGEHSVYWFRHGSGQSHPGIIYTNGDRSGQCKKSPEAGSPTQSCVYNLPKRNLSLSDAGTYYCAVDSCGQIEFGHGTRLEIKDKHTEPFLVVYCLSIALALSLILIIGLTYIIYKINKTTCVQCRGPNVCTRDPVVSSSHAEGDANEIHYAALNMSNKKSRSRRARSNMEEETIVLYAGIRQ